MKLEVLGLNHFESRSATCQTVRPRSSALSSGHLRIAPPQSSSAIPRLSRYQAASRLWSDVDLKKTPPIPVTRAITASSSVVGSRVLRDRLGVKYRRCLPDGLALQGAWWQYPPRSQRPHGSASRTG